MARVDEDFANDVRAALDRRRNTGIWGLLLVLLLLLAALAVWAHFAEIEEVTTGDGRVIPSSQIQVVESLEGGLIAEIFVKEGDVVEAGQPLVRIDDTDFASDLGELEQQRSALLIKARRLEAEARGESLTFSPTEIEQPVAARELALFDARRTALEQELSVIEQQLSQRSLEKVELETRLVSTKQTAELLDEELRRAQELATAGAYPKMDLLRLERETKAGSLEVDVLRASIPRATAAITEASARLESAILGFRAKAHEELTLTLNQLTVLEETVKSAKDKVHRTVLRAPVRGIINKFSVATIGAVVSPGESISEIVPLDDTLLIEAQIRPQDVAFLFPGQPARVRVTAYDYTIYGDLTGVVERIGADTITNEEGKTFYRVIVRTDKNSLGTESNHLPIIPGMVVNASILTGNKTVLDYLLKPIIKARTEALREK
ncbi:MAG: HlyD family type I secretion periplasmic adaptor subunit [Roseibium sp.]|uniref:HlyD family type I secretion periplasmic adaptor subunit n=1 Tax=Roseibium sp. TaxID=1936156 RepID=UPI00261CA39D|nr:HlyD family type I secretion periplasmic adaptor subunit [Roseibium sp.]MCV0427666.1 HlyD family type I secretion periplasmic adaptor subunit [Roseibium sp.]